jgi:protein arginine kinase
MSWYNTEGNNPHVLYSKTCYIRNLASLPFSKKQGDKNREAVFKKVDAILTKSGFSREDISVGESIQALSLAEKGFAEGSFLTSKTARAVYFNEPCSLSISLGGKDLISISSILSGHTLPETRNIASGAEELLDRSLEFAYSDGIGYLSPTPSNCGSGVTFSSLVYLPTLSKSEEFDSIFHMASSSGVEIFPAFIHQGTDLFLITYSPHLLCDENASAESFSAFIDSIIEREKELEAIILEERGKTISDRAWKAYGSLRYARLLEESEMLELSSHIRLALLLTDGEGLPPVTATTLNRLLGEHLNASTLLSHKSCRSEGDLCRARAEAISAFLSSAG